MKKTTLSLALIFSFGCASYAGFSIGLPGAVKNQVNKLDDKVLAAIKEKNTPSSNSNQIGNGTAEITWASVYDASSYNLYWGATQQLQSMTKIPQATSPHTLSGLTNGTVYYYAVSSVVNGIESNFTPISPVIPSASLPQIPQSVSVSGYGQITAASGQTTISWSPATGASLYNIYWSATPDVTSASSKISGAVSPYTHTGLTYGQTYYYRVSAQNNSGESLLGAEARSIAKVYTTAQRTIIPTPVPGTSPAISAYRIDEFAKYGYGVWQYGAGLAYQKLPASYVASSTNTASLLHFFTMSDAHITDKESPDQLVFFGIIPGGSIAGYSPSLLYTTHVLNAAVQTINAIHKDSPFACGLALGDESNNNQYNELRWFIDVLDGKVITPSSGANIGAGTIDYQNPYKASGLDSTIPWYATMGNHDHFWMGGFPVTDKLRQAAIGSVPLNVGNILTDPLGTASTGYYMGVLNGNTAYGTPIDFGPVANYPTPPTVAADANRRMLSRNQWINEFFNTSSNPKGHGFSRSDIASGFAGYTFQPDPNLPVEVIVLDDTEPDNAPSGAQGALDSTRYTWLVSELDKGQAAGNLMIIAAHVPIGVVAPGSMSGWSTDPNITAVTEADLLAKLHTYPNLILWLAGHFHQNTLTQLPSPDPSRPELGFWEVQTASLRDFPQQFRDIRIDRNSDNTLSIYVTDVDPVVDGSLASPARANAIAGAQIFNTMPAATPGSYGAYNAELIKQLSPSMQTKIQNYGTPIHN